MILAGYRQEMFDMLENNAGLRRRFNIDDFGIEFDDMEDEELKAVLISGVAKTGLAFENIDDIDAVVSFIAQKRRMPGFGNAGIDLSPSPLFTEAACCPQTGMVAGIAALIPRLLLLLLHARDRLRFRHGEFDDQPGQVFQIRAPRYAQRPRRWLCHEPVAPPRRATLLLARLLHLL